MKVQELTESHLEQVKALNRILGLQIQWNSNFAKENVCVCTEGDQVLGAGALSYDPSWSYMEKDIEHKLHLDISVAQDTDGKEKAYDEILVWLIQRFTALKQEYPGKKLSISKGYGRGARWSM